MSDRLRDLRAQASEHQHQLLKPPGSLAALETVAIRFAALQGAPQNPRARPAHLCIFAADHPVARLGVSAYPQSATRAVVDALAQGLGAAAVGARHLGVPVTLWDVGVAGPDSPLPEQQSHRITLGHARADPTLTHASCPHEAAAIPAVRVQRAVPADFERYQGCVSRAEALTDEGFALAYRAGVDAIDALTSEVRVVLLGEVGIANTTAAAAVASALLEADADETVGRGTGIDSDAHRCKVAIVRQAVASLRANGRASAERPSGWEVLRRVGGAELVALAAAAKRAQERGLAVLVDGFAVSAALLACHQGHPEIAPYLFFAHRSAEKGHDRVLKAFEAQPLLDLGLRLGEGTGALSALPLLDLACEWHSRMGTLHQVGL